jgi:hypothetical protein
MGVNIKDSDGRKAVNESEEVKLYFPRCEEHEGWETKGGTETIVPVEDDPIVRNPGRRLLERLGHTVIVCSGGMRPSRPSVPTASPSTFW